MYNLKMIIISIACIFILSGCWSAYAPDDWLPAKELAIYDTYGAYVNFEYLSMKVKNLTNEQKEELFYSDETIEIEGELIAIEKDSIIVLRMGGSLNKFAMSNITFASIELIDNNSTPAVLTTIVGMILSPVLNGGFSLITLPLWLISGGSTTAGITKMDKYREDYPHNGWWHGMKKFARFPQGIPEEYRSEKQLLPKLKEYYNSDI